jgi:hypothetical protein
MFVYKDSSPAGEPLVATACEYIDKHYKSTHTPYLFVIIVFHHPIETVKPTPC